MKKLITTLSAFGAFAAATVLAHAQAPRIAVIDIAKVYDNHYETVAQNAKLRVDTQKAQDEIDRMQKEGQALVEQYNELDAQAKNPTATPEAKSKAQSAAQEKGREIQQKYKDVTDLANSAKQTFQQRIQTFRVSMMNTISGVASEVARRHGYTLLLDKSGPSAIGIPAVVYADPSIDITDEVMAEVNKGKPAGSVISTTPAAPSSSGSDAAPKITVPGITP
jgi:outer membrane protein